MEVEEDGHQVLRAVAHGFGVLLEVKDGGHSEGGVGEERIHVSGYVAVDTKRHYGDDAGGMGAHCRLGVLVVGKSKKGG